MKIYLISALVGSLFLFTSNSVYAKSGKVIYVNIEVRDFNTKQKLPDPFIKIIRAKYNVFMPFTPSKLVVEQEFELIDGSTIKLNSSAPFSVEFSDSSGCWNEGAYVINKVLSGTNSKFLQTEENKWTVQLTRTIDSKSSEKCTRIYDSFNTD